MPRPGSNKYDKKRRVRRRQEEDLGNPDQNAEHRANERLQQEYPPRLASERGLGPKGNRPGR